MERGDSPGEGTNEGIIPVWTEPGPSFPSSLNPTIWAEAAPMLPFPCLSFILWPQESIPCGYPLSLHVVSEIIACPAYDLHPWVGFLFGVLLLCLGLFLALPVDWIFDSEHHPEH